MVIRRMTPQGMLTDRDLLVQFVVCEMGGVLHNTIYVVILPYSLV